MGAYSPSRLAQRWDVQLLGLVIAVEVILFVLYFSVRPEVLTQPRYAFYPFVWINVGIWAALTIDVPDASRRHKAVGVAIASIYLLVLLYLAGYIGIYPDPEFVAAADLFSVESSSPGWERLYLVTPWFYITFLTFRTLGFVVLAYLVYVTVLDASGSFISGALGLFSCVSCTFPIFTSLFAGIFGTSAGAAGAVYSYSLDLSTVVFVVSVLLLYWRPTFESKLLPSR